MPTNYFVQMRFLRKLTAAILTITAIFVSKVSQLRGQESSSEVGKSLTGDLVSVVGNNSSGNMTVQQFLSEHTYEPIYFVYGSLYPTVEFQFSFKYRLFGDAKEDHIYNRVYFAYTQTSFWDAFSADPKFYDSSYKPSLFYLRNKFLQDVLDPSTQLDLQTGFEHESNGVGGKGERSLYSAYVQLPYTIGVPGELQLTLQPRVWYLFHLSPNNSDLVDYRGHGELIARLTWKKHGWTQPIQLEARYDGGPHFQHSGEEMILRFNPLWFLHFNPSVQIEYFNGYGDNLRDYNTADHTLRAGFCLWSPDLKM